MINYRESSEAMRKAWFVFKKYKRKQQLSVPSFAAGWNAAMDYIRKGDI